MHLSQLEVERIFDLRKKVFSGLVEPKIILQFLPRICQLLFSQMCNLRRKKDSIIFFFCFEFIQILYHYNSIPLGNKEFRSSSSSASVLTKSMHPLSPKAPNSGSMITSLAFPLFPCCQLVILPASSR